MTNGQISECIFLKGGWGNVVKGSRPKWWEKIKYSPQKE